jgi:translation initiation factor 1A
MDEIIIKLTYKIKIEFKNNNNFIYNKMGKNITGGYTKNQKRTTSQPSNNRIRLSVLDEEKYAIVTKMLGNGMCQVLCVDSKSRLCIIRGGFKGKNKSSNIIKPGAWVLVGTRDWETVSTGKLSKCDLLEIYKDSDKSKLLDTPTDFTVLKNEEYIITNTTKEMDDVNMDDIGSINFDDI